jgi:hypothetical protein
MLRTATVTDVYRGYVDVQVGGSAQITRALPVVGGTGCLRRGDTVLLKEADGVLYAQSLCTGAVAGGAPASTTRMQHVPGVDEALCLNKIMLVHADRTCVTEYEPDDSGFNEALTAAVAGDLVWLPPGELELSSQKTVPDGVTVSGCGMESTTIKLEDSHDANIKMLSIGSNVTIEDLEIDANYTNQSSGYSYPIDAVSKTNLTVRRCRFKDGRTVFLDLDECSEILVHECEFELGSYETCIEVYNSTTKGRNFQITNNRFLDNNTVYTCGVYLDGDSLPATLDAANIKNVVVRGNTWEATGGDKEGYLVEADYVSGMVIDGNALQGAGILYAYDCCEVVVSSNCALCEDAYGVSFDTSHIYTDGIFSQWIAVCDNIIKDAGYGVLIEGPSKSGIDRNDSDDEAGAHQAWVVISGNFVEVHDPVWDIGIAVHDCSFSVISGNVVKDGWVGIELSEVQADAIWQCSVVGNVVTAGSEYSTAISIGLAHDCLVAGNYVARCGADGISVWGERNYVAGNYVIESGQEDTDGNNIEIGHSDDCVVARNAVSQGGLTVKTRDGIYVQNDCNDIILHDNTFPGGGGSRADVHDLGSGTMWGNMQSARAELTGDFTHSSTGSWVAASWDAESHDWGGLWAAGSASRLTFDTGGLIDFDAHLCFEPNATGERGIRFIVDGATVIAQKVVDARGASDDTYLDLSTQKKIDPGSYVEVEVYQDSGGNLNVQGGGSYTPAFCASAIGQP